MLAVTIGVGAKYREMARLAAERVARNTGLQTRVLEDEAWEAARRDGCTSPHFIKLWLFDLLPDAQDIMYFDADMVFLAPWRPRALCGRPELVAVRDRWFYLYDHAKAFGIDVNKYFNSGFFIANRKYHETWLLKAREIALRDPHAPLWDQGPLNRACQELGVPLYFLDRRYNWLGYGHGDLCQRVKVFAAHSITPDPEKGSTIRFLREGRDIVVGDGLEVSGRHFELMGGRQYMYHRVGYDRRPIELRTDGTIGRGSAGWERYWFVHEGPGGSPVLAIGNERSIICNLEADKDEPGVWRGRWLRFEKMPIELYEGEGLLRSPSEVARAASESVPINLLTPYYRDDLQARQEELDECVARNAANPNISRIFLFLEGEPDLGHFGSSKIKGISIGRRMTYTDGFDLANDELQGQICIIANTDVYFDRTLECLHGLDLNRKCFSLARYDLHADGSAALVNHGGMDAWIFMPPVRGVQSDFPLGVLNCDTRITYELHKAGYKVTNPSRRIAIWHLHLSGKRNQHSRVPGPSMLVPITDQL